MNLARSGDAPQPRRWWSPWRIVGLVCVGLFLAGIGRFYDHRTGFTSLISIGDIVKWRVSEYEREQEALQDYIKTA